MSDQESVQRKLRMEWLTALGVVGGGFVIAIAVAAYLTYGHPAQTAAGPQSLTPDQIQRARAIAYVKMANDLCRLELANAQNFGIVPNFGKLANPLPRATDVQGRYVCVAATPAAKYVIAGDLICKNFKDSRCISIFSVSQDDGTVLYHRQG